MRNYTKQSITFFLIAFIFWYLPFTVQAVEVFTWRETDGEHFEEGETRDVSITGRDELMLAPEVERVYDSGQLYIWSLVVDESGVVYAGTGNDGAVYKIKDGEGSLLYDSPEISVNSLVFDLAGNFLYAGTSPRGIIYKIDLNGGEPEVLADLDEEYIWALTFDNRGNLYAGTGKEGRIYKISSLDSENITDVQVLFDSPESHILTLLVDNENNLYAGSEGRGIVYKITAEGKPFTLYEPPQKEIRAMVMDSQINLYAAALGNNSSQTVNMGNLPLPVPGQGGIPSPIHSVVYRITPGGDIREWFRNRDCLILSMFMDEQDNLYLGTGNKGRIYKLNPQQEVSLLTTISQPQILSLANSKNSEKNSIFFGSGNLGSIYTFLPDGYVKEGTFESKVYDTHFISRWGKIAYKGEFPDGTAVILATRSGNTAQPDETWSDWSEEYDNLQSAYQVTSPPARFVQYRTRLVTEDTTLTPLLKEISLAILPRNQAPLITDINIAASGNDTGPGNDSNNNRRRNEKTGNAIPVFMNKVMNNKNHGGKEAAGKVNNNRLTVNWTAIDLNKDTLLYDLYFRGADEEQWKTLEKKLTENFYTADSLVFPDGFYQLKLVASDSSDNPDDYVLTDEETSQWFVIDNTRPVIDSITAIYFPKGTVTVKGKVVDNLSQVTTIEYSIDAGDWIDIYPLDEIFDSLSEHFEFAISDLSEGEHTVVIKVIDEAGNVGSAKTIILID